MRDDKSAPHRFPRPITYRRRLVPRLVLASRRPVSFSLSIVLLARLVPSVLILRIVFVSSSFPSVPSSYPSSLIPVGSSNRLISSHRCRSPIAYRIDSSPCCVLIPCGLIHIPTASLPDGENELMKTARPSYRRAARPFRPRHRPIGSHDGATRGEHTATR